MQVAVFYEVGDIIATRKILPALKERGLDPVHVYQRQKAKKPQLPKADAILYVSDKPTNLGSLMIRELSRETGKRVCRLPLKTAEWDSILLETLGFQKEIPANEDARIALVPPPPPSEPAVDPAPTEVPPPPSSSSLLTDRDTAEYVHLVEKENADKQLQIDNLTKLLGQMTLRATNAEARNRGVATLVMPEPPKGWREVLESLRVLVMYGHMDGLQALDLLANGPLVSA